MRGHEAREIREAFGLSTTEWAELLGLHKRSVERIEQAGALVHRPYALAIRWIEHARRAGFEP